MRLLEVINTRRSFSIQALLSLALLYPFYLTFDRILISEEIRRVLGYDPMTFPAVFGLNFSILLIVATVWAHVLFFRTIFTKNPPKLGLILVKSIDYVWYVSGVFFTLVLINQIQLSLTQDAYDQLKYERQRFFELAQEFLPKASIACERLSATDYEPDEEDAEDIAWANGLCDGLVIRGEDYRLDEFCIASGRWFNPSNDPDFWDRDRRPTEITSALNTLGVLCTSVLEPIRTRDDVDEYREVIGFLRQFPNRDSDPFIYFYFTLVLGLRISKVTFDVAQAARSTRQ